MYVDDIIITDSNKETSRLGRILAREFEIKTLGTLKCFLGIQIAHSSNRILISLQKYFFYLVKQGTSIANLAQTLLKLIIR